MPQSLAIHRSRLLVTDVHTLTRTKLVSTVCNTKQSSLVGSRGTKASVHLGNDRTEDTDNFKIDGNHSVFKKDKIATRWKWNKAWCVHQTESVRSVYFSEL